MALPRLGLPASLLAGVTLLLAACETPSAPEIQHAWDSRSRAEIEDRIAASARRSTNALETLAMIERARTEPIASGISEGLRDLPSELRRPTTVEWSGPAIDLARRLAENIGYAFVEQGEAPSIPVMVHVSVEDVPVVKVFENIGLHIDQRAALIIDPNVSRIEYVHGASSDTGILDQKGLGQKDEE